MKSVFNDKASLVLRAMLAEPNRAWTAKDFAQNTDVGYAWAARVMNQLRSKGYLEGEARGRNASSTLRHATELIQEWTQYYKFEYNRFELFYTAEQNVLPKLKRFFNKVRFKNPYALTLHNAANLMTHYVRGEDNICLYLSPEHYKELCQGLRIALDLKELKKGGNIYLITPYYKNSVFFGLQKIRGYNVVSDLQLYLDLYHYPQRGREHAEYLLRTIREAGGKLG